MSSVDFLILISLIPVAPVFVTWWLPWERWLPRALPKAFLGSYVLYAAFAAWHFRLLWWVVLLLALYGAIVLALGLREKLNTDDSPRTG